MANATVGILGSGDVGRQLGKAFALEGHAVMLGTRDPKKEEVQAWVKETGQKTGTFEETARFGEIVVLATLGRAVPAVLEAAGRANLARKVVIDATNPLEFSAPGGPPGLFVSGTDSLGEQVQRAVPDARVVKAFNIIGNRDMYKPDFAGGPPSMFFCGNDEKAKAQVAEILTRFGHEPLDVGRIEAARYLEAMCMVWVLHGFRAGTWRHAFKMLQK